MATAAYRHDYQRLRRRGPVDPRDAAGAGRHRQQLR